MKIALINENSQAGKNELVYNTLKDVVEPMGHKVYNYGMYSAEDEVQLTYVKAGLLTAILINSGAADFVVTGCGTGEGAMLATLSLRCYADLLLTRQTLICLDRLTMETL